MVFGRTVNYPVSDFVSEIPQSLKEVVGGEKARGVNTFKSKTRASSAVNPHSLRGMEMQRITNSITKSATFIINGDEDSKTIDTTEATPGRKVKHTKFGVGTIISVSGTGEDMLLTIAFDQMGIKKLMLTKSPMEFL